MVPSWTKAWKQGAQSTKWNLIDTRTTKKKNKNPKSSICVVWRRESLSVFSMRSSWSLWWTCFTGDLQVETNKFRNSYNDLQIHYKPLIRAPSGLPDLLLGYFNRRRKNKASIIYSRWRSIYSKQIPPLRSSLLTVSEKISVLHGTVKKHSDKSPPFKKGMF